MKSRVFRYLWGVLAVVLVGGLPSLGSGGVDGPTVPRADLPSIRQRASSMPIDARVDMDKRVASTVERVNQQARDQGTSVMVARLSAEFSVSKEILLEEKGNHGWSWGDIVIAYTLLANTSQGVTTQDLASLREDGLGWASIAYGLQFRMEDFEEAIKSRGRVATGLK
jgi:hypothetical protein